MKDRNICRSFARFANDLLFIIYFYGVDEIVAEVFPNIKFETYSGLLAKRGQEVIKEQYGMTITKDYLTESLIFVLTV